MSNKIAEPWNSFLSDLDRGLSTRLVLHCLGGFAINLTYGLSRQTADIDICEVAFSHVGHDWRSHVVVDPQLVRRLDSRYTRADPAKARAKLGWQPQVSFESLIKMMVDARVETLLARRAALAG